MISKFAMAAAGAALLIGTSFGTAPALAQSKEVDTATQHAGLATKASDLKTVQQHLHHVINCLVGPNGAGFDASFGNPCNGQGSGAIPATAAMSKRKPLETALAQAQDGVKQNNIAVARLDASMAQDTLMGKARPSKASAKKKAPAMSHPM